MNTTTTPTDQLERNKDLVRRVFALVMDGADPAAADELAAADYLDHESPIPTRGPAQLLATATWLRNGFGDMHYDIEDVVAEGDRVAVRLRFRGHHTGEFLGIAPTGRAVDVQHVHMIRIHDDKIAEHWACRDDVGLFTQIGSFPTGPRP
jgi:predicted SnoaL-like aldol condensation-catalyzing enzyme